MNKSFQNLEVLDFYKKLPFNIYDSPDKAIQSLKLQNPIKIYPPLKNIIVNNNKFNTLDIGSGVGWFVNSLSYFFNNISAVGIDYNPVAIEFANSVKNQLKLKSIFYEKDLFKIDFDQKFNLITSLGVLHHTNNCLEGIKKIIQLSPEFILLGLYHKFGRKPFLDYFNELKKKYSNLDFEEKEEKLFYEYKKLDNKKINETHLKSWFKDQVLHPHETQHTFEEILPIFVDNNYKIFKTSLNRFEEINDYKDIINSEKDWFEYGINKLKNKEYFPGFFIVVAKKIKF